MLYSMPRLRTEAIARGAPRRNLDAGRVEFHVVSGHGGTPYVAVLLHNLWSFYNFTTLTIGVATGDDWVLKDEHLQEERGHVPSYVRIINCERSQIAITHCESHGIRVEFVGEGYSSAYTITEDEAERLAAQIDAAVEKLNFSDEGIRNLGVTKKIYAVPARVRRYTPDQE